MCNRGIPNLVSFVGNAPHHATWGPSRQSGHLRSGRSLLARKAGFVRDVVDAVHGKGAASPASGAFAKAGLRPRSTVRWVDDVRVSTGRVEPLVEGIRPAAAENAEATADEDSVSSSWSRGLWTWTLALQASEGWRLPVRRC